MIKNTMKIRTRSILVGLFILIAYGVLVSTISDLKVLIMVADVFSGLAVIGIAVLLFPLFKRTAAILAVIYLALKMVEGVLMVAGGIFFLIDDLQHIRDWVYEGIHLYVFIVSGYAFYYLLITSKIVPRFISVWGAVGITALFISTVLGLFQLELTALDYFVALIITNEVFLAAWLMVKGIKVAGDS